MYTIEAISERETRTLRIEDDVCVLTLQAGQTHQRRFAYSDIVGVFISVHPLLCWQVGNSVYCIPVHTEDDAEAVEAFLEHIKAAQGAA